LTGGAERDEGETSRSALAAHLMNSYSVIERSIHSEYDTEGENMHMFVDMLAVIDRMYSMDNLSVGLQ